ncbi:hypothetical protein RchiOBHm_Chr3g0449071 [Rosa chinensis]|uniref:Transmembrane protein n=1 Tax=Rosa chinensis TaxID=74649 RepID=A0A2P6R5D5_ROSCH|nr:hypothetical protein RchiOBHm_Chr3g0449071 [Rosa chinensis]
MWCVSALLCGEFSLSFVLDLRLFFLCSSPISLQMPRFIFTSLILIQLPFSSSTPFFSFSTILPPHLCSTWAYTPNSTPGNSCRTGTSPTCVDVAGPVVLCCSVVSTTTTAVFMSLGTFILFVQTVWVWRMMVDKSLASGTKALVDVTLSAAWWAAAMAAAGLLEAVLCGCRSRVVLIVVGLLGLSLLFSVRCRLIKLLSIGLLGLDSCLLMHIYICSKFSGNE